MTKHVIEIPKPVIEYRTHLVELDEDWLYSKFRVDIVIGDNIVFTRTYTDDWDSDYEYVVGEDEAVQKTLNEFGLKIKRLLED